MMEKEKPEFVLDYELRQEITALIDEVQKCTREVAYDNGQYPDLLQKAKDDLDRAEGALGNKIRDLCRSPRNEIYRCLAVERAQAVAMQAAHAQAITQVFSAMADRMEKMRQEHAAKIRELETK